MFRTYSFIFKLADFLSLKEKPIFDMHRYIYYNYLCPKNKQTCKYFL